MAVNFPEIIQLVSIPEFKSIIQCPICYNVPFPPRFYHCIAGHNICDRCKPNVQDCPVCRDKFVGTRNNTLEKLVLACTHSCRFRDGGCGFVGTGDVMSHHILYCQYRTFTCTGDGTVGCCRQRLRLFETLNHFLGSHKAKVYPKMIRPNSMALPFIYVPADHSNVKEMAFKPTLIEFDENNFVAQVYTRSNCFFWTVFCIGTKEQAGKYEAEIIFSSDENESGTRKWVFTIFRILSISKSVEDFCFASCSFDDFKKVANFDEDCCRYRFRTEYKISRHE